MLDSHDAVRVFCFAQVRGDASVAALHEKLDAEFHAVNAELHAVHEKLDALHAVHEKLDAIPTLVKHLFNSSAAAAALRMRGTSSSDTHRIPEKTTEAIVKLP